jgi:drug/metabolite transporter (DMT)-like permease
MSGPAYGILLVCLCAMIEGLAHVALKLAASPGGRRMLWIAGGIVLFVIRAVVYSGALRFLNVSVAFGVDAVSLITIAVFSMWLLRERLTRIRWIGMGLILLGAGLVAMQA